MGRSHWRSGEDFEAEAVRLVVTSGRSQKDIADDLGIGRHIDGFYNPVRRHSALDFISPLQFEKLAA